jgi:hypothetical protein
MPDDEDTTDSAFARLTGCKDRPDLAERHAELSELVAKAGDRYRRISRLIEAVATVLMIGLTVGAFVGSASLFPTYATSRVLDFLLALIVGCVVALSIEVRLRGLVAPRFLLVLTIVTSAFWWFEMAGDTPSLVALEIVAATFALVAAAVIVSMIVFVFVDAAVQSVVFRSVSAEARAVHSVSVALKAVAGEASKRVLIRRLDAVATSVYRLRWSCGLADPVTRQMCDRRFAQVVQAVRATSLHVALPGPDTRTEVGEFLADLLHTLLTGHYDQLPRPDTEESVERGRRLRASLTGLGTILMGCVPLGILLVLRSQNYPISEQILSSGWLIAVAWALTALDPRTKERLDVAKNLGGLLTGKADK